MTDKNLPIRAFKDRNLEVALWSNEVERDGQMIQNYSFTWQKRYRDKKTDEWKDSSSLFPEEALRLARLLQRAYDSVEIRESAPAMAEG